MIFLKGGLCCNCCPCEFCVKLMGFSRTNPSTILSTLFFFAFVYNNNVTGLNRGWSRNLCYFVYALEFLNWLQSYQFWFIRISFYYYINLRSWSFYLRFITCLIWYITQNVSFLISLLYFSEFGIFEATDHYKTV